MTHPTLYVLRVTRLPVGRRASGFVLVGKYLSIEASPAFKPVIRLALLILVAGCESQRCWTQPLTEAPASLE